MDRKRSERGQSLVWTAVLLLFVVVPLLILIVDGLQLWRIRNQLQTATDAACEEAAWVAADRRTFRDTGNKTVANQSQARSDALDTFHRTLHNTGALQYSPALVVGFDTSKPSAQCQSSASVTLLLSGIIPAVTIETRAEALIRFSR
jgi:hypothetical protein